jgi:2'-5' RNA ligase
MVAILPPEPIYSEVQEFKQHVAEVYNSIEAVKRPAHITVIPPIMLPEEKEKDVVNFLTRHLKPFIPFELSFDGFGVFGRRVIYVQPEKNELLEKLFQALIKPFNKKFPFRETSGPGYGFNPHMTIAYRDLKEQMFDAAWREFSDKIYRRKFMLGSLYLMRHTGKEWIAVAEIPFGSGEDELTLGF